jgi:hypothetical protein
MPEARHQEFSNSRGGLKYSPVHVLALLVATALLVLSAVLLIMGYNLFGVLAMLIGGILCFLNF